MATPASDAAGDIGTQRAAAGARGAAFCPNVGAPDTLELFRSPGVWDDLRGRLSAFKLYLRQVLADAPSAAVGSNTYPALVDAGVFHRLREWGLPLHLETDAVKEWEAPDRKGQETREPAQRAIERVRQAGGEIAVLCMDEPLTSTVNGAGENVPGKFGVDRVGDVARFTGEFSHAMLALGPAVALLEAYPHHPADRLDDFLRLVVRNNGVPLAFFELDVDLNGIRDQKLSNSRVSSDLEQLGNTCRELSIPFRAIVTGTHARSAAEFREESLRLARLLVSLARPLDGVTVQSWVEHAGEHGIPPNLPLADGNSHLAVLSEVFGLPLLEAPPASRAAPAPAR
jgi:hypothetical protein